MTKTDTEIDEIRSRLDMSTITIAAEEAQEKLDKYGVAVVRFSPGDATVYSFVVIDQEVVGRADSGGRYAMACSFGRLRALPNGLLVHPGYMGAYLDERYDNLHTRVVLASFVNELGRALEGAGMVPA